MVTGLRPSTVYVFHVRARTAAGYTAYSPNFEFTTAAEGMIARDGALGSCGLYVLGRNGTDNQADLLFQMDLENVLNNAQERKGVGKPQMLSHHCRLPTLYNPWRRFMIILCYESLKLIRAY